MLRHFFISLAFLVARLILSLRYRIVVEGKSEIEKKLRGQGGVVFLPNHSAHVDPIIATVFMWPSFELRPLAVDYIYRQPFIRQIMKWVRAISVPDFEHTLSESKIEKADIAIAEIIEGLKAKKNFLLYPSGHLKASGREIVGGTSGVYTIFQKYRDAKMVLVRTTGLWGSSFSRAYLGKTPHFVDTFLWGFKKLLQNGIFFMPRREVRIQFEYVKEIPQNLSRLEFNHFLEEWYNRYPIDGKVVEEEPLKRVSYLFWKEDLLTPFAKRKKPAAKKIKLSPEDEKEVIDEIARIARRDPADIRREMSLAVDLGFDSMDILTIVSFLGLHFEVGDIHPSDTETVNDILEIAAGQKKSGAHAETSTFTWKKERRKNPRPIRGETICEAFLNICDCMKNSEACGDDLSGVITYRKFKIAVLLLSEKIKKLPGDRIGILLPSSMGAYLVILATLFAKKVPVMLNWTLGKRFMNHMSEATNIQSTISSWRFLERISGVELGQIREKIVFVEDIKDKISLTDKLGALFRTALPNRSILKKLSIKGDDIAVILFTSGSEATPKGVPLSHKNILTNQEASFECAKILAKDVFLGVLPPFHSFGFSLVGLLPILTGIRVVYSPDPTDSYGLAEVVARWKATIVCFAPSFLKGLLQAATPDQLKTVRYFVVGAEKASEDLYESVKSLKSGMLIEGYGITECAPVITINRPDKEPSGVGAPLKGIELCTIGLENRELLAKGAEGEICVKGPNVFNGYLLKEKDPFIMINGERWYRTGDLGFVNDKGALELSGRLKRFAKIGGEMVSLGGIEEILSSSLQKEDGAALAVCSDEKRDKPSLVLFSTFPISVIEANSILKEAGFSRIIKISEVRQIEAIPLMGTGKVDYRTMQGWV